MLRRFCSLIDVDPANRSGGHVRQLMIVTTKRGRHCFVVDHQLPIRALLLGVPGLGFEADTNPWGGSRSVCPVRVWSMRWFVCI